MATVIPPPSKKARLALKRSANLGAVENTSPAINVVVQFTSSKDGSPIGPPIRLPANTDRQGLELLANQLAKAQRAQDRDPNDGSDNEDDDDEPTPYSFHVALPATSSKGKEREDDMAERVPVLKDLQDVIKKHEQSISVEDVLNVVCEPEAVFKVRQITRCSSTLSGEAHFSSLPGLPRLSLRWASADLPPVSRCTQATEPTFSAPPSLPLAACSRRARETIPAGCGISEPSYRKRH